MPKQMTIKPGTGGSIWALYGGLKKRDDEPVSSPAPVPAASSPATPSTAVVSPPSPFSEIAKALLPHLSPEDESGLASYYGFTPSGRTIPTQINRDTRNSYLGGPRATAALMALENMRAASGQSDLGPGYVFLTNAIKLLQQFGGSEGMSRQAYTEFETAMNELFSQAKGNESLNGYTSLAGMFLNPTFSAGQLMPRSRINDRTVFGSANAQLYT